MVAFRPTPARPTERHTEFGAENRALPPELGTDAISVVRGSTFMYSDSTGDVPPGSIGGLVHRDTRMLSHWQLTLNGAPLLALRSGALEHHVAQFMLTNPALPGLPANSLAVRRVRQIGPGMRERIDVQSYTQEPARLRLRLAVGVDFADIFEIKSIVPDRSPYIRCRPAADGSEMVYRYERDGFVAQTTIRPSHSCRRPVPDEMEWDIELSELGEWGLDLFVSTAPEQPPTGLDIAEAYHRRGHDPIRSWLRGAPVLTSGNPNLSQMISRTLGDLAALRLDLQLDGQDVMVPAAGMPWFLTLFGRDTLITAYQTLSGGERLARGALLVLAEMQGKRRDDLADEEPGKIPHEVRCGELTQRGQMPYSPYYGSADATQLWLIVLSEYWRWTRDDAMVRQLRGNVLAALEWIDRYGDRDGDGYVEYATRSPHGLGNQCWRDSWDGVRFADGRIPVLPIATCEIQGYTYDAKLRVADLADGPLEDPALAARLRAQAAQLWDRFNRDFWIEERGGYYALGLDGDKNKIDSVTSNLGHLLWSGIVPPERAGRIARRLLAPDMFSGYGIRTLSREDAAYNPLGYHLGTVWPHDNSIAVAGLTRYGFRAEANRVALGLIDAAAQFDDRLPEALGGFARERTTVPVPYPTACKPQAWSTAAGILLVRCMLGAEPGDGEPVLDPDIPPELGHITIDRQRAFGTLWKLEATGRTGTVHRRPERLTDGPSG